MPANYVVLHEFHDSDGNLPNGDLIRDDAGNFYGATYVGGSKQVGVIFKMTATGNETVLHNFMYSDGANPSGGLVRDASGNLYGVAGYGGGQNDFGVVYKLDSAQILTVLHAFTGSSGDGAFPIGRLVRTSDGRLFGATEFGGNTAACDGGCGTIFEIDASGKETVIFRFNGFEGYDVMDVIRDSAGDFYGTTSSGGDRSCTSGCGVAYKLKRDSSGVWHETVLHYFKGPEGDHPRAALFRDGAGNLFGTTYSGGMSDLGVAFKIQPNGRLTVLHNFNGSDGENPRCNFVSDSAGNLYGSTYYGGDRSSGLIFKLDASGGFALVYQFNGLTGGGPAGGLFRDNQGDLFGAADKYGANGPGLVFELSH
ncbi:MAG TPA: choice-of-anchor tandem repeat GloVer-containing protein [Candidatus Eremiobacteraceae bacterium]|nr:choice-of-anchor tandem repeat GloVer-containing protein [Candidatus Eremiobacteraceae bacterium]